MFCTFLNGGCPLALANPTPDDTARRIALHKPPAPHLQRAGLATLHAPPTRAAQYPQYRTLCPVCRSQTKKKPAGCLLAGARSPRHQKRGMRNGLLRCRHASHCQASVWGIGNKKQRFAGYFCETVALWCLALRHFTSSGLGPGAAGSEATAVPCQASGGALGLSRPPAPSRRSCRSPAPR